MATERPPVAPATPEQRERARLVRAQLAHKPPLEELLGQEGIANAVRFSFTIRLAVDALRKARETAGLSAADVATKCGVSEDHITQLEAGAFLNPTWKLLGDYAHAVGVKLSLAVEPAA
jgi:DNA-binding XRE family transcriptional regulator